MADFFERCQKEPGHWDDISQGALDVVLHALVAPLPDGPHNVQHVGQDIELQIRAATQVV